jgi:hypothetical protein
MQIQQENFMTLIAQTGADATNSSDPEISRLMAQANQAFEIAKYADLLSRYEQRKIKIFREVLAQLKELQNYRDIFKYDKNGPPRTKGAPIPKIHSVPAVGFVFSEPEIIPESEPCDDPLAA